MANADQNGDLYWAVRGAGSNFGVVTSIEFQLHPVGPLLAKATTIYALEDGDQVARGWRDFMAAAPDEVSSHLLFWGIPAIDDFPAELHGKPVIIPTALYSGDPGEGERILQPLRSLATPVADLSGTLSYVASQSQFDDLFPKGWLYYWKSLYLAGMEDDAIAAMIEYGWNRPTPMSMIALWHLEGGAASRVDAGATAFGRRDHPYLLSFDTTWTDPADTERSIAWTRDAWSDAQQYSSGGLYLNFAGFGEEKEALVRASYGSNYERLSALKAKYDPGNLFRMNSNVRPMGAE